MRVPGWLTLGVAALVGAFGAYRIYLALRRAPADDAQRPKRGIYAMSKSTHLFIGFIYLLLSGGLIAAAFGWNPLGGSVGPDTETPSKGAEPSKPGSVPVDQLPEAPKKDKGPSRSVTIPIDQLPKPPDKK